MRIVRTTGILFILLLSIYAAMSTAASAALPEFLGNVVGNTFTATSGKAELLAPANNVKIVCEKDTISLANGKVTGAKTIEVVIDFEQCTDLGFAANTLGDKNDTEGKKLGLILVPVKGELCYITAATKHVGIFFTVPTLHIEVPTLAELLELKGSVIGLIAPDNKLMTGPYTLTLAKENIKECGVAKAVLLYETNHDKKPIAGEMITTETITFDKEIELMA